MASRSRAGCMFPSVILDMILGHFTIEDGDTLSSCVLVCRSWAPTARRHRFGLVNVTPHPHRRPHASFLLCDPTSTVLPYVRRICLVEGVSQEDCLDQSCVTKGERVPWLDGVLPHIRIQDLTALQMIYIRDSVWGRLSPASVRCLKELCKRVTTLHLSYLHVEGIRCSQLVELLSSSTSLRHLSLSVIHEPTGPDLGFGDKNYTQKRGTLTLSSLSIKYGIHWYLLALTTAFSTPRLTHIEVENIDLHNVSPLVHALKACSATLEHLELRFYGTWRLGKVCVIPPDSGGMRPEVLFSASHGLSALASLRTLHIDSNLNCVPDMLRQIGSPHFEHLTIEASPYMLTATDPDALACAISDVTCAEGHRTRRTSFICTPDMAQSRKPDFEALFDMRDKLLQVETLQDLHKRKKLQILRRTRCPISRWASGKLELF